MMKHKRFAIALSTFAIVGVSVAQLVQAKTHAEPTKPGYALGISSGPATRLAQVVNLDDLMRDLAR